MSKFDKREAALGLLVIAVIAILVYLSLQLGVLTTEGQITVFAYFDDAGGLVQNGAITIAGVNVGKIGSLAVEHNRAKVELHLKKSAQVRTDVKARIRARSLLGDKFLELIPQNAETPLLSDQGVIMDTESAVELDQLFTAFKPAVSGLQSMAPQLASLTQNLDATLSSFAAMLTNNRTAIESLAGHLESISAQLDTQPGENRAELATVVQQLSATLKSLNQSSADFKRLHELLVNMQAITQAFAPPAPRLAQNLDVVLATFARIAPQLPETTERLNRVLAQTERLLPHLEHVLTALDSKSGTLGKLVFDDTVYEDLSALLSDVRQHPWKLLRKK